MVGQLCVVGVTSGPRSLALKLFTLSKFILKSNKLLGAALVTACKNAQVPLCETHNGATARVSITSAIQDILTVILSGISPDREGKALSNGILQLVWTYMTPLLDVSSHVDLMAT